MSITLQKHLLIVNVYFTPYSFGGATIVAENMALRLQSQHNWKVTIITTINNSDYLPYSLVRYESNGLSIIAINLPPFLSFDETYKNTKMQDTIDEVIKRISPDVVHVHSIQNLGASILDNFKNQNIPIALTLHDCWWICERQFMIKGNNTYCHQEKIDINICARCVNDPQSTYKRHNYLTQQLAKADILLYPSEFHKNLHVENGVSETKSFVNKNGIFIPPKPYKKQSYATSKQKVRFGFSGGPGPIKGLNLIKEAFAKLERSDYELVLVDAAQNLNTTWRYDFDLKINGKLTISPSYNQNTMDDFFGNIDVLLFPSMWKESFGLTVREALARDVWVIATNGGGTVEDCYDNENSTLIPLINDSKYLLNAVQNTFNRNWIKYENPHKSKMQSISSQALELSNLLLTIAS